MNDYLGTAYKDVHFETKYTYLTEDREYEAGGNQNFISPFLNYEMKFLDDQLIFNIGGRYDFIESDNGKERDAGKSKGYGLYDNVYPEKTWEEFSPKGGVVFHPEENTAIRASIGRGFRAPTLFELYKTHTRGTGVTIANPDLEPEEIVSYDLGAEKVFFDTVWARITYYQSYAKDLIASRTVDISNDLSVSRKFSERVGLSLQVENIFDKKYVFGKYDDYDSVSPGRVVMGKVKLWF